MSMREALTRDAVFLAAVLRTLALTHQVNPDSKLTIADWVERHARERGQAPAILCGDRTVSYRALDEGANRYAQWAMSIGLRKGDVVALLMENCPEYLMAWLGLTKAGVITALINTHLQGTPLAH